jgi:NADH-quinone oxidoreductase subunit H
MQTMWPQIITSIVVVLVMTGIIQGACAYLIFLERKVAAWCQDRLGPNRTNFSFGLDDIWQKIGLGKLMKMRHFGLGQALADGLKLFLKEDYTPPHVERALFLLAPVLAVVPAMLAWAVIPWGGSIMQGAQLLPEFLGGYTLSSTVHVAAAPINLALIYVLAIGSTAVYAVVVGGYASNNKYAFLGGLRGTAQMLSYEIPQGLCILIMILMYGTSNAGFLVGAQAGLISLDGTGMWGIVLQPVLAVIFFTCVLAECNRAPFDLVEAEQELVGGYHTEYSSMKWALFFLGEYMHMITGCGIFVILFLGGWDILPGVPLLPEFASGPWYMVWLVVLLKFGVFAGKITLLLFVMMWIRWSLPRFRFDQLMKLAWRSLIPTTLVLLLLTGFIVAAGASLWWCVLANVIVVAMWLVVGPRVPAGPPVNRRVPLAGSRFCPLPE